MCVGVCSMYRSGSFLLHMVLASLIGLQFGFLIGYNRITIWLVYMPVHLNLMRQVNETSRMYILTNRSSPTPSCGLVMASVTRVPGIRQNPMPKNYTAVKLYTNFFQIENTDILYVSYVWDENMLQRRTDTRLDLVTESNDNCKTLCKMGGELCNSHYAKCEEFVYSILAAKKRQQICLRTCSIIRLLYWYFAGTAMANSTSVLLLDLNTELHQVYISSLIRYKQLPTWGFYCSPAI